MSGRPIKRTLRAYREVHAAVSLLVTRRGFAPSKMAIVASLRNVAKINHGPGPPGRKRGVLFHFPAASAASSIHTPSRS